MKYLLSLLFLFANLFSFSQNSKHQQITYHKNGKIKSILDTKKRSEKVFFPNGQLKLEKKWSRKGKIKMKEYFQDGQLSKQQNHKTLERYNSKNIVIEKIKRKEILILERIFAKKKHGRDKFYWYEWKSFDDQGTIKRKMIFNGDHFNQSPFPQSVQQIDNFLFEEIIFYFNGKEFKKMALELINQSTLSRKLVVYRREGKKWIREKTTSIDKTQELIKNYSF